MARSPWFRRARFLLIASLALAAAADFLFYGHGFGCSAAVFAVALTVALVARHRTTNAKAGMMILLALDGLAVALALEPGVIAIVLSATGWVGLGMVGNKTLPGSVAELPKRVLARMLGGPWQAVLDLGVVSRWRAHRVRKSSGRWRAWARWVLPVLLTSLFVLLFAQANPVIEEWVSAAWSRLSSLFDLFDHFPAIDRILLWALVALVSWGLLRTSRTRRALKRASMVDPALARDLDRLISTGLVLRCLILFNAAFLVQSVLDLIYLWGGAALPHGMTYAAYAHRGAYPLIATALLAACFVLICFRPKGPAQESPLARRLVYAWLAQNVFLVVSSLWRLHLYVDVYSLSRWRIAAGVWMALVACGLVLIGVRILRGKSNAWLVNANGAVLIGCLYVLCFIDLDGAIAWHNVKHCKETGSGDVELDARYLESLGPAALPALSWYVEQNPSAEPRSLETTQEAIGRWRVELRMTLSDWRGWTWFRQRWLASSRR